jgi:hypothetical protein
MMTVMMIIIRQQYISVQAKGQLRSHEGRSELVRTKIDSVLPFLADNSLSLSSSSASLFSSLFLFNSLIIPSPARYFNIKMARGRKGVNGNSLAAAIDSPSDSTPTPPPRSLLPITPTPSKDRDVVKVNNASLSELKNALDDAIKRVRSILFRCTIT